MIHPKTELKFISDHVGYGVFATEDIPEGTIVYVKDSLELVITPMEYQMQNKEMKEVIEKYSYIDEHGDRIISWDFAKYVNHCCNCNTMSTGYGFEIAIRDIKKGEEITDEYGLFNLQESMDLVCGEQCCRKKITPSDFDDHYQEWDVKIKKSMARFFDVEQPLIAFMDEDNKTLLELYHKNPKYYKSVYALKYQQERHLNGTNKVIA